MRELIILFRWILRSEIGEGIDRRALAPRFLGRNVVVSRLRATKKIFVLFDLLELLEMTEMTNLLEMTELSEMLETFSTIRTFPTSRTPPECFQ